MDLLLAFFSGEGFSFWNLELGPRKKTNNTELHVLGVVLRPPHVCLGYPSARSSASEDEQADEVQCPITLNTANGNVPDFELRSPKTTPILLL